MALATMLVALPGAEPGCAPAEESRVVTTDRGPVRGYLDGGSYAFRGIPFAAPPVGDRRWRAPEAPEPWTEPLDARDFGPLCPQPDSPFAGVGPESEDCLHLNVWTPTAPAETPRAVMAFVHGGGNIQGGANLWIYAGAALAAAEDVVVVTLQYRVGILGFLADGAFATESARATSGNYGLLDQIAALGWIRRNIAAFGGDPDRVLLFGESAGAVNACALLISPLAEGLFHAAVMESGDCLSIAAPDAEEFAGEFRERTGCGGAADPAACLRAIPWETIGWIQQAMIRGDAIFALPLGLSVDGAIVPEPTRTALRAGGAHPVPIVMGTNRDEIQAFIPLLPIEGRGLYELITLASYGPAFGAEGVEAILARYPYNDYWDARAALTAHGSDYGFHCPTRRTLRALAARHGAPAWRYVFTKAPNFPIFELLGPMHGAELPYVFGNIGRPPLFPPDGPDRALADAMMRYWANFARTGDPNGAGLPAWPPYEGAADTYMEFGAAGPVAAAGFRTESCDFWDGFEPES